MSDSLNRDDKTSDHNVDVTDPSVDETQKYEFYLFTSEARQGHRLFNGMTFGRRDDADVTLRDTQVSGQHFRIYIREGEVLVVDLGSANKTYVNGDVVPENQERSLRHGDILQVGEYVFGFSTKDKLDFHVPFGVATELDKTLSNIIETANLGLEKPGTVRSSGQGGKILHEMRDIKRVLVEKETKRQQVVESLETLKDYESQYASLRSRRQEIREAFKEKKEKDKRSIEKVIEQRLSDIEESEQEINKQRERIAEIEKLIDVQKSQIERLETLIDLHKKDLKQVEEFENITSMMKDLKKDILELRTVKKGDFIKKIDEEISAKEARLKKLQSEYAKTVGSRGVF